MDSTMVGALATAAATLVAAVGVGIGVTSYRRQMNAQVFLEYTRRYEAVMAGFPADARGYRLRLYGEPPPESQELRMAVLRYLNLCSEEYYLCHRGFLAKSIWNIWEDELKRTLRSPLLLRKWPLLREEFLSYSEFAQYVDRVQTSSARTG